MNSVLLEDFNYISNSDINFEKLENKVIMITGATGLIGSLLVKSMLFCDKEHNLNLKIVALVRNKNKVNDIYNEYQGDSRLSFKYVDLLVDEIKVIEKIDYIIHTAAITNSKYMVTYPVDTINTSIVSTNKLLKFAVDNNVQSFVYVSSMEVYGTLNKETKTTESDLGFVDLFNVRSSYPESKRMCECMAVSYAEQYSLNVKIARLAQTFGAGILKNENRVFAQFARSVINKNDIVLHTTGKSEGNYVYTRDAMIALLKILLEGNSSAAYNVSNEECHTTICNMAKLVAEKIANNEINVVFDIPEDNKKFGYAADTKMWLSSEKLQGLGWRPSVNLVDSYKRMIMYMNEENII